MHAFMLDQSRGWLSTISTETKHLFSIFLFFATKKFASQSEVMLFKSSFPHDIGIPPNTTIIMPEDTVIIDLCYTSS